MPTSLDQGARESILYHSRLLAFFNSLCYAFSLASSKASILLLYWRFFKFSVIRVPIMVLLAMSLVWITFRTFMLIFRCVPVHALWDTSVVHKRCSIDSTKFFFATIATHFAMDIVILLLPIAEIYKLQWSPHQKLAVVGAFMTGVL